MDRSQTGGSKEARLITVKGRVQGVGFRPFLFRLAEQYGICGTVQNNMDGIRLEAEGPRERLERLVEAIRSEAPRLSRIEEIEARPAVMQGFADFRIVESSREGASSLVLPVDAAVCPECLGELRDPADRRFRYPFITCTQCGPRFTIIRELPYDRPYTSMSGFAMCPACQAEYEDVRNRRHHAQPIACPDCGPQLRLLGMPERAAEDTAMPVLVQGDEAIRECGRLLRQGAIVAVKGLGGYHLACNATDEQAVRRLRQRKRRPTRPLAVMAATPGMCREAGFVSAEEEALLESPESPIVLVRKRRSARLASSIAPGMETIGLMLPYTPLHHLLLEELPMLIMTSANPSGQPILYRDEEAAAYLAGIADYILAHNREIIHPLDDSVVQLRGGETDFLRRSRGYAPDPLPAPAGVAHERLHNIAAYGGQQKNTFALGRGSQIFLGPHIGDMADLQMQRHWQRELEHLSRWLDVSPSRVAADLHPGYVTGRLAEESGAEAVLVQHHHAHLISCAADNGIPPECSVLGIILDGTGFGTDGCIWGFEVLRGNAEGFARIGHLRYSPLPGGEASIRHPWRNATAMLGEFFGDEGRAWAAELFPGIRQQVELVSQIAMKRLNTPMAGTCGRLFDAVAAILGLVMESRYDGEAAIRLSELVAFAEDDPDLVEAYPYAIRPGQDGLELDMAPALAAIVLERLAWRPVDSIALRFHETVARGAVELLVRGALEEPGHGRTAPEGMAANSPMPLVMLTGGSFHNRWLAERISGLLLREGFQPCTHKRVPAGDGGLALGQLVIAAYGKK